jgi:AcrR family transcriptional regulator
MTGGPRAARRRILDTAAQLFYRDGFRAVGIDTIIAESGVAKMTLYRHFPSKDHLVAAYLEEANGLFWAWLDAAVAAHAGSPRRQLIAVFEAVGALALSPTCLGCTFQGAAAEFPGAEHPAHRIALAHKRAVIDRLATLAVAGGLREPTVLAEALLLLMDGAWAAARMFGPHEPANPARRVAASARALIAAHAATG